MKKLIFLLVVLLVFVDTCSMQHSDAILMATVYEGEKALPKMYQALKQGARVNTQFAGNTALHMALYRGPLVVKALIDYGADVNIRNAAGENFEELIKKLSDGARWPIEQVIKTYKALKEEVLTKPNKETLRKVVQAGYISLVKQILPKLTLTAQEDKQMAEMAKQIYQNSQVKDPAYQEIGRIFQTRLGVVSDTSRVSKHGLIGVHNLPHDVADVIRQKL